MGYRCDFGDSWSVTLRRDTDVDALPGRRYPRCVDGRRVGSLEDCGGPGAYQRILDMLSEPGSWAYRRIRTKLKERGNWPHDPARCDLAAIEFFGADGRLRRNDAGPLAKTRR